MLELGQVEREWNPMSRRSWLRDVGCGFGMMAASLLAAPRRLAAAPAPQFAPRARRVIFLFMQGGVSQVDSFDHKPALAKHDGAMLDFADARVLANSGRTKSTHRVMKSPWRFARHGQSGRWVSELFPHLASQVDRLCFIHSLHTEGVAHGPATLFLHCGATNFVRPSMGAWVLHGLGTENQDLPGFVSISPSIGNGGPRNYGHAFLPAQCQGMPIGRAGNAEELSMRYLESPYASDEQRAQGDLLRQLNHLQLARIGNDATVQAAADAYHLAQRLQGSAPDVFDLSRETASTLSAYGIGDAATDAYGRKCLLARRLCEAGVRFVQVNYGDNSANPAWDQHSNLPKHADHARAVDQPIAALLADLAQRGLLEDTLVWWGGEFGRTPYAEKNGTGRDHNPGGFTVWLAGGGVRPGLSYGETDEFGHAAVRDKVHMHDLHATLLHLLGVDHEQLTYRFAGRDFRLTDVHGRVIHPLIA